ncbi:Cystinosin/ERS1p repeat [Aspergillus oryzae]|uniref:Cystinosin/ERS1p repeat n=1 Tax=Aspergillus oryzae TaxID=5062 RepID=A0A1S9DV85_ASPOZ|nr:Cystinosin/ERS1p repeat [Aspergillus oryzae]
MSSQLEIFLKALSRYVLRTSATALAREYPRSTDSVTLIHSLVQPLRMDIHAMLVRVLLSSTDLQLSATFDTAFLYSPVIRHQYAARHPGSEGSTVRFNDFAFAVHAIILSILTYTQFWPTVWGFKVSRFQRVSKPVAGLFWGSIAAIAILIFIVLGQSPDGGYDPSTWGWIDVVYGLSYVKLLVTITKYVPQAWVNYKRKSTQGWHIGQILLDLVGGVLSLIQLFLDSSFEEDWSGITGNPIKFLLSNVSILFDFLFMIQHYILYKGADEKVAKHQDPDVTTPLLTESNGARRTEDV